jgi:hypothetical protein
VVLVSDTTRLYQLSLRTEAIRTSVNEKTGRVEVKEIRFKIGKNIIMGRKMKDSKGKDKKRRYRGRADRTEKRKKQSAKKYDATNIRYLKAWKQSGAGRICITAIRRRKVFTILCTRW